MSRPLRVAATLLLTGLAVAYLIWKVDLAETLDVLADADPWWFLLAVDATPSVPSTQLMGARLAPIHTQSCWSGVESRAPVAIGSMPWTSMWTASASSRRSCSIWDQSSASSGSAAAAPIRMGRARRAVIGTSGASGHRGGDR